MGEEGGTDAESSYAAAMTDLQDLLATASVIDIVDWPHQDVPGALVRAGYTVVATRYPPDPAAPPYLLHEVIDRTPTPEDGKAYELRDGGHLLFRPLGQRPPVIDIASAYRPPEEQPAIVEEAIRTGARAVWIEPGVEVSSQARDMAVAARLAFVEGTSIADAVSALRAKS